MTLFAVACAGIFPLLHLGRPIYFYWLAPYPDTMGLWPQFRSPLVWDMFAVSTYATVSLVFWYIGSVARSGDDPRPLGPIGGGSAAFTGFCAWAGAGRAATGRITKSFM